MNADRLVLIFVVVTVVGMVTVELVNSAPASTLSNLSLDEDWVDRMWEAYKEKFSKDYKTDAEDATRRDIFAEKLMKIVTNNVENDLDQSSFRMGFNHMTDWKPEELSAIMGARLRANRARGNK